MSMLDLIAHRAATAFTAPAAVTAHHQPDDDVHTAVSAALAARHAHRALADLDTRLAALGIRHLTAGRIEYRSATAAHVDTAGRTITVMAVPYLEPAEVEFRGEIWQETFERAAFQHDRATNLSRIPVNRDHDRTRLVGKLASADPNDTRGMIAVLQIARTQLGDETLALADEGMLSASVGFGVPATGEVLDRRTKTRRITRAHLDHIALVAQPAYDGAKVLAVTG